MQVHLKDGPVITDKREETNRLSRFIATEERFSTWGCAGPPGDSIEMMDTL